MAGFNNLGISGPQQAVSQAINQPMFVNQRAVSPYGGQGSAYTIDVLNSLQPLGVNPNQYPNMQPPPVAAAPAQNNQGPFSPQQQNSLNNAFNQQSGAINASGSFSNKNGSPQVMDAYGQMLSTNAPGSGLPHPANMWSPEQLYAQSLFHRLGLGNYGSYAPGGFNYQAPQGGAPAAGAMAPQQNFQSALPPAVMAHGVGGTPLGAAPMNYQNPAAYSPPPSPAQSYVPPAIMALRGAAPPPPVNNLRMPTPAALPQPASPQNLFGGHYGTVGRGNNR